MVVGVPCATAQESYVVSHMERSEVKNVARHLGMLMENFSVSFWESSLESSMVNVVARTLRRS